MLGNCGQVPALSELIFSQATPGRILSPTIRFFLRLGCQIYCRVHWLEVQPRRQVRKTALLGWNFSALAIGFRSQWQSQIGS